MDFKKRKTPCGHVSASSQSLPFILSLRLYSSFITSKPGHREEETLEFSQTHDIKIIIKIAAKVYPGLK